MILYIDTSSADEIVLKLDEEEFKCEARKEKSQKLLGFIEETLKRKKKTFKDLNEIVVNTGPGSFTGLRVGVSVAQALGYALNIPVNGKDLSKGEIIEIKYE